MSNLQKSLAIFVKNRVPNNLDVIRGLAQNRLSFIEGFTQQLVGAPEVLSDAEFVDDGVLPFLAEVGLCQFVIKLIDQMEGNKHG
jgi:hypothetical protein